MQMRELIETFPAQLEEAIEIAENARLQDSENKFQNVLITGLGGSGIGGRIVADILRPHVCVPIVVNNDYHIPAFVGPNTLVIVSSYSGNTEETLHAMEASIEAGAVVACITSGGKVAGLAQERRLNHIIVPGGKPPRACFGYSLVQQFRLLAHYGIHELDYLKSIKAANKLITEYAQEINDAALATAKYFQNRTPVIYCGAAYEGVCIRMRQQLNENSKVLCWHHVLPEMNHNELVGWGGGKSEYAPLLLKSGDDYDRTEFRMKISEEIIQKYTDFKTFEAKGSDAIERTIYLVNFGDWASMHLAELKGVDAIEIEVIEYLKSELSKV